MPRVNSPSDERKGEVNGSNEFVTITSKLYSNATLKERDCFDDRSPNKRNTKPKMVTLRPKQRSLWPRKQIPFPDSPALHIYASTSTLTLPIHHSLGHISTEPMNPSWIIFCFPLFAISFLVSPSYSCSFTVTNNCPHPIWPGTLAGAGTPQLPTTGFRLDSGQSLSIPSVPGWSGRIWARTGCTFDESGTGSCQTGDCGGKLECEGNVAAPPASLFEITLGSGMNKDFYDVSIVDGYNLPILAAPRGVHGTCNATGCIADINMGCPKELQVVDGEEGGGGVVACKSACEAFGLDQYCCSGEFANPTTCGPSFYSTIFKRACPRAYSYAYDDGSSTFTCKASDYAIVFCPNSNWVDPSDGTYTDAVIHESIDEGKSVESVSSSSILLPLPTWIIILLFILTLRP